MSAMHLRRRRSAARSDYDPAVTDALELATSAVPQVRAVGVARLSAVVRDSSTGPEDLAQAIAVLTSLGGAPHPG
ncbi:hypothetical protein GCM10027265_21870 [Jatrophihabitans fulvus]